MRLTQITVKYIPPPSRPTPSEWVLLPFLAMIVVALISIWVNKRTNDKYLKWVYYVAGLIYLGLTFWVVALANP